jgi:hypothetical protein
VADLYNILGNYRPVVEDLGHIMAGSADYLNTPVISLLIRFPPAKAGKKE